MISKRNGKRNILLNFLKKWLKITKIILLFDLLANGEDTNEHAEELAKFKAVRAAAKKAVDELLKREK